MNVGIFVLGLVVLLGGLFAGTYTITSTGNSFLSLDNTSNTFQPFDMFSLPLLIARIVLILVGALIPGVTTTIEKESTELPVKKKVTVREEE